MKVLEYLVTTAAASLVTSFLMNKVVEPVGAAGRSFTGLHHYCLHTKHRRPVCSIGCHAPALLGILYFLSNPHLLLLALSHRETFTLSFTNNTGTSGRSGRAAPVPPSLELSADPQKQQMLQGLILAHFRPRAYILLIFV